MLVPDPEWMRVWQASVKLETRLLSRLGHHFIDRSLDFVGSHSDRIQQVIIIKIKCHIVFLTTCMYMYIQCMYYLYVYLYNTRVCNEVVIIFLLIVNPSVGGGL